jgi:hypothetical protein
VVWLLRAARGAVGVTAAVVILGAATFAHDWRIGKDFIVVQRLEDYIRSDRVIEFLRARGPEPFRVLSAVERYPANYLPIFEIESPQGFHDNRVRSFDELVMQDQSALGRPAMLDLLNVRYVVSDRAVGGAFQEVFRDGNMLVLENGSALARASLHRNVQVLDHDATLPRMRERDWSPRAALFVEEAPAIAIDAAGDASGDAVRVERYTPNRIDLHVSARSPAMLLVTNHWLPYWRASIDGQPAPVVRANYSFQAIAVPAGDHAISLRMRSAPFERAKLATGAGLAAAACVLLVARVRPRAGGSSGGAPPAAGGPRAKEARGEPVA